MDRRAFLAAGGAAAMLPAWAAGAEAAAPAAAGLFSTVKFTTDGLSLSPPEYAAVLQRVTAKG